MALYSLAQGGLVNALDSQQIINLMTGVMTDQAVNVANRIQASLTGSASASGYVGGTATGAPASGAHLAGDFATDQTGTIWVCSANGTPGTWSKLGAIGIANTWTAAQGFPATNGIVMGTGAAALTLTTAQASAQTATLPAIRQAEFVAIRPQQTFSTPADPTGTTNTTGLMMGLSGTITPQVTGRIIIFINGTIFNGTVGDGANVQMRRGTGTAPVNAAALTGTATGGLVKHVAATAAHKDPFCLIGIVTGLAINTAVWLDVGLAAVTGGTATITDVSIAAVEV